MQAITRPVTITLELTAAEATELVSALHCHELLFEREMLNHPNFSLLDASMRAKLHAQWGTMIELERKAHRAINNAD